MKHVQFTSTGLVSFFLFFPSKSDGQISLCQKIYFRETITLTRQRSTVPKWYIRHILLSRTPFHDLYNLITDYKLLHIFTSKPMHISSQKNPPPFTQNKTRARAVVLSPFTRCILPSWSDASPTMRALVTCQSCMHVLTARISCEVLTSFQPGSPCFNPGPASFIVLQSWRIMNMIPSFDNWVSLRTQN